LADAATEALDAVTPTETISLFVVSVDHFDAVNASHGTEAAEEALLIAGDRIGDALRANDIVERSSDDGFSILWKSDTSTPEVTEIAARIVAQFDEPIKTASGRLIPFTASIGISSCTGPACDEVTLLTLQRQARLAVLKARRNGRAQIAVFDQAVQDQAIASYETERRLRSAILEDRLNVAYQPILSLHSGEPVYVEALARWDDDTLGEVDPTLFISIAEESGLIGELGRNVLQQALAQASQWAGTCESDPVVSINLSNRQLLDPSLISTITTTLDECQLDPRSVCFEITESVVMNDVAASMTILGHMKDLGLRLAIDDFGTGYSSLAYLRRLPVDVLKIDQSFVQSIYNRDDRVITKAIIDLAHTLGMTTIAEGVETRLQVEVLQALNCDMAQGFYLHNPTEAERVDFSTIDLAAETTSTSAFPHSVGLY